MQSNAYVYFGVSTWASSLGNFLLIALTYLFKEDQDFEHRKWFHPIQSICITFSYDSFGLIRFLYCAQTVKLPYIFIHHFDHVDSHKIRGCTLNPHPSARVDSYLIYIRFTRTPAKLFSASMPTLSLTPSISSI
eukprot:384513_1